MAVGLGFIDAPNDRAAGLRGDKKWLTRQLVSQSSRFVVFCADRPAIHISDDGAAIHFLSAKQLDSLTIQG